MTKPSLLWFRHDLRLTDHPALLAALAEGGPVLPVFVLDDEAAGPWRAGGAARWWLRHSLAALQGDLAARGAPLLLARGRAETVLPALADALGAARVHAGRAVEPWARRQTQRVHEALAAAGRALALHTTVLLREPHGFGAASGKPYAVYTPFARTMLAAGAPPAPLPAPERIPAPAAQPGGESLDSLGLYPVPGEPDWAAGFPALWQPGEAGAAARLARFVTGPLGAYDTQRNLPGMAGSSGLSPHLRWGEVSPRQVWQAARQAGAAAGGTETFLKEILWREFAYHLLWHRPEMPEAPLRAEFAAFPWQEEAALLQAWQRGRTGYPIVDAGMRQLWQTGWMHNRVRMIAASLLVKHLLQPWQAGAAWFWDTLVDADLASNSASWQWVAGCGTDATPYFRVFNPVLQGEKFDAAGQYVRRFVPELARLPDAFLHQPWAAPAPVLAAAGVRLGVTYPRPVVDHAEGRARALAGFATLRA
ncbi:cryptochrome/photolyase family protein [Falsiroseomonas selenitidurans]|uniref:Deoxyribodipyrimidine photo-lyase n=2 Tax=Falsiroseomonas selenitidurans TaxID=2716335 RepID=A0ABX1E9C5_9PROT|nr:deoxyribodipyrimidine photo-lyase [Falsiroseomonas selenitidurans]NKC33558.1 deoxyribodipyrimidine photo-lyase [Falsiroseomonas selenitidurans]